MAKRMTDTGIWDKEWFMELRPKYKLFWFYIKDKCDYVGVWDVNLKLVEMYTGYIYNLNTVLELFDGRIIPVPGEKKKWWIPDFCFFQYGELKMDSASKVVQTYILQLKKYNLWENYLHPGNRVLEKEKEKEKVKENFKGVSKGEKFKPVVHEILSNRKEVNPKLEPIIIEWLNYKQARKETYKNTASISAFISSLKNKSDNNPNTAAEIIETSMANNWAGIFPLDKKQGSGSRRTKFKNTTIGHREVSKRYRNDGTI